MASLWHDGLDIIIFCLIYFGLWLVLSYVHLNIRSVCWSSVLMFLTRKRNYFYVFLLSLASNLILCVVYLITS